MPFILRLELGEQKSMKLKGINNVSSMLSQSDTNIILGSNLLSLRAAILKGFTVAYPCYETVIGSQNLNVSPVWQASEMS